jgi:hypothetical protein
MEYYAQNQMKHRRQEIARLVTEKELKFFSADGSWHGPNFEIGMREIMWFANAFLEEGSSHAVDIANTIISKGIPEYRFCHFLPFNCLQTIYHYGEKLLPETIELMDEYVHTHVEEFLNPELDFVGANDNFPCMSTGVMLFAGQRYGNSAYIEKARERIKQFVLLLERRGFSSEYTSPTYTPIQALVLADIANYSEYSDIKKMAIYCEQRILGDLLMHLFWPAAQCAGAASRAYPVDAAGCTHHARFLYYMLYGEELSISLKDTLFAEDDRLDRYVAHHSWDFLRISAMWQAMPDYHCPKDIAEWAKNRQYPYICAGTCETINNVDNRIPFLPDPHTQLAPYYENPFRENFLYTYMTDSYALGSARYEFHNGYQSHGIRLLYKKTSKISSQEDIGSMFLRYTINDHEVDWSSGEYFDLGHKVAQQNKNTAMILYSPRILYHEQINSLKLTVNFICTSPDEMEIWADNKQVKIDYKNARSDGPVFIKSGNIYLMLQPLYPNHSGKGLEICMRKRVLEIAFMNYRGDFKDFDRCNELLKIGNGVAIEVRSKSEVESFENFRKLMKPIIQDRWFHTVRQCKYENQGQTMAMEYSPFSQSLRYVLQNDRLVSECKLFSSGFTISDTFH